MILGLDVGGTHADTVLVARGGVARTIKIPTGSDLLDTLGKALTRVLEAIPLVELERVVFSTTLATNAVVQDRLERVGMMVLGGPGLHPDHFAVGPCYQVLPGVIDHRGKEIVRPSPHAVDAACRDMRSLGIEKVGVVGKFSVRQPAHEQQVCSWIRDRFSLTVMGHTVAGALNFPRRIHTTYLNAALHDIHTHFLRSLRATLDRFGIDAPCYLLKPEGGTILMERTMDRPAHTAQSGPAASIIGALALHTGSRTAVVLDIGGTTTDMGVLLDGTPLTNPRGIDIGAYQTLIPSLYTRSIGAGGDSRLWVDEEGILQVGPMRSGAPYALGGPDPTPTDALIFQGLLRIGKRSRAVEAMEALASRLGVDPAAAADKVLRRTAEVIAQAAEGFIEEINSRPVYTISEMVEGRRVEPREVIVIGGPAPYFARLLEEAFGLPVFVPPHYKVANAVGAACARVTTELTLHADTHLGMVVIPEEDVKEEIGKDFTVEQARKMALDYLRSRALREGAVHDDMKMSIVEEHVFNIVRDFQMVGRNIRLRAAVMPGLHHRWAQERKD